MPVTATATLRNAFRSRAVGIVVSVGVQQTSNDVITLVHRLSAQSIGGLGRSGTPQNLTLAPQAVSNYEFNVIVRSATVGTALPPIGVRSWNGSQAIIDVAGGASTLAGFAVVDIVCVDPFSTSW